MNTRIHEHSVPYSKSVIDPVCKLSFLGGLGRSHPALPYSYCTSTHVSSAVLSTHRRGLGMPDEVHDVLCNKELLVKSGAIDQGFPRKARDHHRVARGGGGGGHLLLIEYHP